MKSIIFILCLLTTFCPMSSTTGINSILDSINIKSQKDLFKSFHYLYKKEYELNSSEGFEKYIKFKENLKWIEEENKKQGKKIYGITKFSDLSREEFKDKFLISSKNLKMEINKLMKSEEFFLENKFEDSEDQEILHHKNSLRYLSINNEKIFVESLNDIPQKNTEFHMPPVKDQGNFKSSWAFATISTIEAAYHLMSEKFVNLSEQNLINCLNDNNDNLKNVNFPVKAFNWIIENGVIESKYVQYKGIKANCEKDDLRKYEHKVIDKYIGFYKGKDLNEIENKKKWLKVLNKGPILVAIDASFKGFQNYKPKSFTEIRPDKCGEINHFVVAYGITIENGKEFILLRNSFGEDWGFEGNFKIPMENACGIMDFAFRPILNEKEIKDFSNNDNNNKFNEINKKNQENTYEQKYKKNSEKNMTFIKLLSKEDCPKENNFYEKSVKNLKSFANNIKPGCMQLFQSPCNQEKPDFEICNDIKDINFSELKSINLSKINSMIYDNQSIESIEFCELPNYLGKLYSLKAKDFYSNFNLRNLEKMLENTKSIKINKK